MNTIKIEQTLHGYSNGHRLLSSSCNFPDNEMKTLTILSDLSGNEFVKHFEKYYTGYSLNQDKVVLACTWYATEMKRPGCVWTHSLILSKDDLKTYGNKLGNVVSLFRKPINNDSFSFYNNPIQIELNSRYELDEHKLKYLIWCLWGNRLPLVVFADNADEYEKEMIYLYLSQYEMLPEKFSFCTGAMALRLVNQKIMDFQIAPNKMVRSSFRIGNGVNEAKDIRIIKNYPVWVNETAQYLIRDNMEDCKKFISGFSDFFERSKFLSSFIKLYVSSRANEGKLNLYNLLQMADVIFLDKKRICKEIVELYFHNYFSAWSGKEEYVSVLEFLVDSQWFSIDAKKIECIVLGAINSEYEEIKKFFETIVGTEENKTIEEILKAISHNIKADMFEDFTELQYERCSIMVTLNTGYARCKGLWKQSKGFQQGIIKCIDPKQGDENLKNEVVATVLLSSQYDLAYDLYKIYGESCINEFWHYAMLHVDAKNIEGIKQIIKRDISKCILMLKKNLNERKAILFLIDIIDAYNPALKQMRGTEIEQLVKTVNPEICSTEEKKLLSRFLMPICLMVDYTFQNDIVRFAYKQVNHMLATQSFPENEWEKLEKLLPELAWYNNWDRCKRLKKGLKRKGYQIKELREKDDLPSYLL